MARSLPEDVFPYLVLGLAKYMESERKYPYPDELRYALNHLSLVMLSGFPTTITDMFSLFESPLEEWWPGTLPPAIDPRFELLYEGELDEQVVEFLLEYDLPVQATLQNVQVVLDNQKVVAMLNVCRSAYIQDPSRASEEYIAARQYIIAHPWTSAEQIRRKFRDFRYITVEAISSFYRDSQALQLALLYQRQGRAGACYWNCPACGPLYLRDNRLGSLKPNACLGRCPGPQGWDALDPVDNPLVLRRGIHLRTFIPGVTELQLYHWLVQEAQPDTPELQQVLLWPGVDCYDLQLIYQRTLQRREVWAVDVKDYKDPFVLGRRIAQDNRQIVENALEWNQWYYVYPSYRELQRSDYRACVLRAAGQLPANVHVVSEKQFKVLVTEQ
ncbi:hypothetical protein EI42_05310 [Thermosporothrix hazakensis]|jgi:hypothetical protein|uniref:REase associating with pPIWI RE domain-containing protein n=2 Tax=Thermosporothrix TaxID=768650 RepID=A0A326U0J6_THEHA|nr:hypothetical protein [Thermosporothrix hazakensis]PZW22859.1 hypothetical protein EI42_05310 [Thermosporothrix hazakensis]BBH91695.1 hypothetical protein KTC_64460 [Thermosporothrix sp. COM3]GCE49827.1 hypothetical protein KTH_46960 [Thermosporothrix hazakensis]